MALQFEWDDEKEQNNVEKHGVDFDTAVKVFFDPNRIELRENFFLLYIRREKRMYALSRRDRPPTQKGGDIMIIRRSIDEIKPELTKEQMVQLERAERMPVVFDEDCPEFTDEMAEESYRPGRKIPMNVEPLTLFLSHETVDKARAFGDDYVSILSRMLDEAVNRRVTL
ncbi:MAG: BrnT family toxin [Bacteroides sp.]|nr:BrnT family toxin [Bacteroides sp.]